MSVHVKIYGAVTSELEVNELFVEATNLKTVFGALNMQNSKQLKYHHLIVFVNGEHIKNHKKAKLTSGDEVHILTPAAGG